MSINTKHFHQKIYFLWCSPGRNHNGYWLLLLLQFVPLNTSPPLLPLSVASSREHQKTNTMLHITRQRSMFSPLTKTNSLLRPDLNSLNRGKKTSCRHGVRLLQRLINSLSCQISWLNAEKFKQTHIVLICWRKSWMKKKNSSQNATQKKLIQRSVEELKCILFVRKSWRDS